MNSIRARLSRLLSYLERRQPDVLCLQETKVEDTLFPSIEVQAAGYQFAHFGQRTYNGVALLVRTPTFTLGDVRRGMEDGVDDTHSRLIAATVGGVRILSVYVPNGQVVGSEKYAYKLEWLARLRRYLEREFDATTPLLVCGDFNVAPEPIDVHDPAQWEPTVLYHPTARAALANVVEWGLVDAYRKYHPEPGRYSWWDYRQLGFPKGHGLRIDHVLVTPALAARCTAAEIDREERKGKEPSDHAPVVLEID